MSEMPKWLMDKMSDESFKEYTIGSMADDAFQHGAMSCYQEMQKKLDIAVKALEDIKYAHFFDQHDGISYGDIPVYREKPELDLSEVDVFIDKVLKEIRGEK